MGSFQLNGSLNVDQPNATGSHTATIQPLAGAPTNNYMEITDTTDASGATVVEYVGMGNSLGFIGLNDRSTAYDTIDGKRRPRLVLCQPRARRRKGFDHRPQQWRSRAGQLATAATSNADCRPLEEEGTKRRRDFRPTALW
jgi:hypothetical protein